ncbi:MAG TPA: nitroreductase/quinone reductase family protein [Trebonia sp.]|nr:nitroreductase/quinone reductase family protein [Trebonia sp.]
MRGRRLPLLHFVIARWIGIGRRAWDDPLVPSPAHRRLAERELCAQRDRGHVRKVGAYPLSSPSEGTRQRLHPRRRYPRHGRRLAHNLRERPWPLHRVIDITSTGRQTGQPRRIEIWFHRVNGKYYITGTPGQPRSWYANLLAHPAFTFHLKESATAGLPATARPVTEPAEREQVLAAILASLPDSPAPPVKNPPSG